MSAEKFVAAGAIVIITGVVQDDAGNNLRSSLNIQAQGTCEKLQATREGLQQLQALLLEATAALGVAMTTAPSATERVLKVNAMPAMPKGFRM